MTHGYKKGFSHEKNIWWPEGFLRYHTYYICLKTLIQTNNGNNKLESLLPKHGWNPLMSNPFGAVPPHETTTELAVYTKPHIWKTDCSNPKSLGWGWWPPFPMACMFCCKFVRVFCGKPPEETKRCLGLLSPFDWLASQILSIWLWVSGTLKQQ